MQNIWYLSALKKKCYPGHSTPTQEIFPRDPRLLITATCGRRILDNYSDLLVSFLFIFITPFLRGSKEKVSFSAETCVDRRSSVQLRKFSTNRAEGFLKMN